MIDDIIRTHEELERELKIALSTMDKKDTIPQIREKMIQNQKRCPHFDSNYNWAIVNEICPYCGFRFARGGEIHG